MLVAGIVLLVLGWVIVGVVLLAIGLVLMFAGPYSYGHYRGRRGPP